MFNWPIDMCYSKEVEAWDKGKQERGQISKTRMDRHSCSSGGFFIIFLSQELKALRCYLIHPHGKSPHLV